MSKKPRVKSKQEVAEEIQRKILCLLFERAEPIALEEICSVTEKSKSETQYHCECLGKQGWLCRKLIDYEKRPPSGDIEGIALTPEGRRHMVEDAA